jgi:hypothetical protein
MKHVRVKRVRVKRAVLCEMLERFDILQKGGALPPGSIRTWGGVEYVKAAPGDWRRRVVGKERWDSSGEKARELTVSMFGTPEEVREMANPVRMARNYGEAKVILYALLNQQLKSKSGLNATISRNSIKEMLSGRAENESFHKDAHLQAAANIDKLFTNAIEPWKFELNSQKHNENLKEIHRLYAPMEFQGKIISVKITVKEMINAKEGKRIYSIEAIDAEINKGMQVP